MSSALLLIDVIDDLAFNGGERLRVPCDCSAAEKDREHESAPSIVAEAFSGDTRASSELTDDDLKP